MERRKLGNYPNGIMSRYHIKPFNRFSLSTEYSPNFWAGGDPLYTSPARLAGALRAPASQNHLLPVRWAFVYNLLTLIFILSVSYLSFKIKFGNFFDPLHSSLAALENTTLSLTRITSISLCSPPYGKLFGDRDHIFFIPHGLPPCSDLIHFSVNTFVFCWLSLMSCAEYQFYWLQLTIYNRQTTNLTGFNFLLKAHWLLHCAPFNLEDLHFSRTCFSDVIQNFNFWNFYLSAHA